MTQPFLRSMMRVFVLWFVLYSWLDVFGEANVPPDDGHLYLDDGWIVKMPKISGRELVLSPEGLTSAAEELVIFTLNLN